MYVYMYASIACVSTYLYMCGNTVCVYLDEYVDADVDVDPYVCGYTHLRIYIYIYIYMYHTCRSNRHERHITRYIHECVNRNRYIYTYTHACVYVYIYMYVYMYIHISIYTYIYIHVYIHIHGRAGWIQLLALVGAHEVLVKPREDGLGSFDFGLGTWLLDGIDDEDSKGFL